jgi:hypothetical protein
VGFFTQIIIDIKNSSRSKAGNGVVSEKPKFFYGTEIDVQQIAGYQKYFYPNQVIHPKVQIDEKKRDDAYDGKQKIIVHSYHFTGHIFILYIVRTSFVVLVPPRF